MGWLYRVSQKGWVADGRDLFTVGLYVACIVSCAMWLMWSYASERRSEPHSSSVTPL